ncbi:uncharacterized protein BJX67DRAFT_392158 [Aspergillus lucknowensis]|uniref:Uncharacterized protein n=1 Tax=Aspergillus lucknowensis TaxID=176173 RepID=A0ABR4L8D8_9EURO
MARLCIPGVRCQKGSHPETARLKTRPAVRPVPRLVTNRANLGTPCRWMMPVSTPRSSVRPFPTQPRPTSRPSFRVSSRLEERRAARQARPRPWARARPRSPVTSRSDLPSANLVKPPSKPKVQATRAKSRAKPAILIKGPRKDKSVRKCVRFGATTTVSVPRWIVRREHVYSAPPLAMGHIQGWSVTPLAEPDEDGEEEKYTTYWGSDSYVILTSNHAEGPCDRYGCAWNALGWVQAMNPTWYPEMVFEA